MGFDFMKILRIMPLILIYIHIWHGNNQLYQILEQNSRSTSILSLILVNRYTGLQRHL